MARKIKAELWDKMQFMFRNYYDRMVHAYTVYDGILDKDIIKTVLIGFTELVPILHSRFVEHPIDPYWEEAPYSIEDILTVKESADIAKDADSFLTQTIPYDNNVQYKVALFYHEGKTHLSMIVNHMCFDGGDFKYFLAMLAANYNNLANGINKIEIKTGSRSYDKVYTGLSKSEQRIAEKLYKNISAVKDEKQFPFTAPDAADKNMICNRKIAKEVFEKARLIAKGFDATANDLLLAVYVSALYDIGKFDVNSSLTIPCMVDLRRHISDGGLSTGLTNHTGFMQCGVNCKGRNINETLINVIKSVNKSKRDKYIGLYSLPLLNLAYTIFPYKLSEFAISKGYSNPLIGMSNIGVLNPKLLSFKDAHLVDGFITGAVKYKPYMQLAVTTLDGAATLTIAIKGNAKDAEIAENFFDIIEGNFKEFISINS
ncbi:MAG: condensation domain-containing protein [Christensenellales bacterium]|jgi:NRPS condensation-like uncharacterized protein